MRFKNSQSFIEIVLLKLHNIFHKISYPEKYSTSNDISYQTLGPLFSKVILLFQQKKFFHKKYLNGSILNNIINSAQGSSGLYF